MTSSAEHGTVDYVVVGGGSAGCVLAARLTEDPYVRVLVLEAGPPDLEPMIKVPAAFAGLFRSPLDWAYEIEPQEHVAGSIYWPRGRTLGGSSSINLMVYARGVAADYDGWAAAGCSGWDFAGVLPYFVRSEHNSRLGAPLHGTDGPLYVEDRRYTHELSQAWIDAAVDAGLPRLDDLTAELPIGVGSNQVTCRDGRRWSAADAYLRPALGRPNLTVRTGAQATRVLFDGLRATGVAYRQDGVDRTVSAEAEVLLCGGTVNSPQLLLLSGVGPADALREQGGDVVIDLPGVGKNLHDHPFVPLVWATRGTTDLQDLATPENMALWQRDGSGPFTSNGGEVGGFLVTEGSKLPDVQLVAGPTAFVDHGFTRPPMPVFTGLVAVVAPRSRGRLTLRSGRSAGPAADRPSLLLRPGRPRRDDGRVAGPAGDRPARAAGGVPQGSLPARSGRP
jgi:choline dehydrogenase